MQYIFLVEGETEEKLVNSLLGKLKRSIYGVYLIRK